MSNNQDKKGFTLIELSIVLLIIGLIVGGITSGASLIKQAQLRSVINEINIIKTAVNSFKIQFNALPGDFNNAYAFWPSANCPAGNFPANACNGNGNNRIEINAPHGEQYRVWQHLSLAELIQGTYNGTNAISDQYSSKYPNGTYILRYVNPWSSGPFSNILEFGRYYPYSADAWEGLLVPKDAYNIDLKIDDGIASSGKLYGMSDMTGKTCSYQYGESPPLNNYNLSSTEDGCVLNINID